MSTALNLVFSLLALSVLAQPHTIRREVSLMGSGFELIAVSHEKSSGEIAVEHAIDEIKRIENRISSWIPHSETSYINDQAGISPVKVSSELFSLIERCIKVSNLTEGAFDISFNSIEPAWIFDGREIKAPDSVLIRASVQKIDFKKIQLDRARQTVFLEERGMKIGFGAIGKGYAANRAKKVMLQYGIRNGLINAGGDLIAWGNQPTGEPWRIGIADPTKEQEYIAWLDIRDMSVVTSGNYEKYVYINGRKYGHIIDPRSGFPVRGIQSVTLVSPDAELSDALATSVFVLGIEKGLKLVNMLKNTECLIVDDKNDTWTSDQLKLNYY